jgi:hypothetical protein
MYVKNITFLDDGNTIIKSCKMMTLQIKEESIINKSIEFFHDPEPCFIHRSAVMKRIIVEMDDYFYNISKQGINEIKWSAFPDRFRAVLDVARDVGSIHFII